MLELNRYKVPNTSNLSTPKVQKVEEPKSSIDLNTNIDADKKFGQVTKDQYERFIRDFLPFEDQLLAETSSTRLVDRAADDAIDASRRALGMQQRAASRYGGAGMSTAQMAEQTRLGQLGGALGVAGSVNTAQMQQDQINNALLADLINIGQGVNRTALSGLATASANEVARENTARAAKAQRKSQMMSMGATIIGAGIMAGI